MIAHVVLFRPRPDLGTEEVAHLLTSFEKALRDITLVQRARVGHRITIGRGYEQMMRADYPYAAVLEFDSVSALRGYLEHPAHAEIGSAVFAAAADILVCDFEMGPGTDGISAVAAPI